MTTNQSNIKAYSRAKGLYRNTSIFSFRSAGVRLQFLIKGAMLSCPTSCAVSQVALNSDPGSTDAHSRGVGEGQSLLINFNLCRPCISSLTEHGHAQYVNEQRNCSNETIGMHENFNSMWFYITWNFFFIFSNFDTKKKNPILACWLCKYWQGTHLTRNWVCRP